MFPLDILKVWCSEHPDIGGLNPSLPGQGVPVRSLERGPGTFASAGSSGLSLLPGLDLKLRSGDSYRAAEARGRVQALRPASLGAWRGVGVGVGVRGGLGLSG